MKYTKEITSGMILIDKHKGISSGNLIRKIGRIFGVKSGHIGTLDPMAEGLLPTLLGNTCKLSNILIKHDKTYIVEMKFGQTTNTLDLEGDIVKKNSKEELESFKEKYKSNPDIIENVLKSKIKTYMQTPPIYSAKKYEGKKLYEIALKDEALSKEIALKKESEVTIYNIYDISFDIDNLMLKFTVDCSSGTYVRSLVYEIGEALNLEAVMTYLRRDRVGSFSMKAGYNIDDAVPFDGRNLDIKYITEENIINDLEYKVITLREDRLKPFLNGLQTRVESKDGIYKLEINNSLIGLCKVNNGQATRMFVLSEYL